jgi:hypothetical protein
LRSDGGRLGRTTEGESQDGGFEELRAVGLTRTSSRPRRSSKVITNTRTDCGVAAQSSAEIPAGGVLAYIDIAFLYHSPARLTNFPTPF